MERSGPKWSQMGVKKEATRRSPKLRPRNDWNSGSESFLSLLSVLSLSLPALEAGIRAPFLAFLEALIRASSE